MNADATAFAASVRDLLADTAGPEALRAAWDSDSGRVPGLWKRLADIGVPALTVPERYDGAGMDLTWAVPLLVECARAALPEPVTAALAGVALLASFGGPVAAEWLPRVAAGEAVLALGEAGTPLCGGRWADLLLLASTGGVRAVAADEAEVQPVAVLDPGLGLGLVRAGTGAGTAVEGADAAAAFDTAVVAVAGELVGLGQAMLDRAVAYAKTREQFGKPIGSFQAVKHQLADVYVALAFALPVVLRAAESVAHDLPSRARDASHAKLAAGSAAELAARTALQVHAGIGYTYENDLHMWMKRTWSLTSLWGDPSFHRRRVTAALL